jgi:hypothetical protein
MEDWVTIPYSSNKLKQTYFQNFVDISGVMSVRNSNNINLYASGSIPDFSINSHQIRVKENENYYDISNSKLRFIQNLYENVQDKLEDLTSRTQYLTTSSNDGKAIFGSSIEISNNLICFSDLSLGGNLFIENYSTFNGQVDICGNLYANYPNNSIPISAITNLEYNLNTKSNLISPDFTGIPTTPTATSGTNTNQIATTAFVTNAVSMKADLASPTFTGTPSAPTAISGTNTTQIATTAFVADAVTGLGGGGGPDLTQDISVNTLTIGIGSGDISTNSVFGYQVLSSNTTGFGNVANGYESLLNNTTGHSNVANGRNVLYYNTTGSANVAIGREALYSNTTASSNVAVGSSALYNNTTGYSNVATGSVTLYNNTTGIYNTANGYLALYTNTYGSYNTANGSNALRYNYGYYNSADGYLALYNNTSGSRNTATGFSAGYNNTTASFNTFIGATTNISPTNASWTQSTALGYGALITASNQIVLGRSSETVVVPGAMTISGIPTAPTAISGTNTTQIATTEFVADAVSVKADLASPTFTGTVSGITNTMVGLGNVDNTSDANKPVSTAQQTALDLKADLASPTFTGTVSGITNTMVGLGNVDNTSDANKPVSTAQQTALDLKANLASPTFTGTVSGITNSMVGLGNVDNTSDANKPVSAAQQTALDLKANLASPTFTGTVSGITNSMVGLGNVDNTSDANKPVSTAQQTALDLKADLASPTFTGTPNAPTATSGTNTTQIATTAFVTDAVSGLGGGSSIDLTQDISINSITVGRGSGNQTTNTVFGNDALSANTNYSFNTAFGYRTLKNTINNNNSAFGTNALLSNTNGAENSAFGASALYTNLTSYGNSAFGSAALRYSTSAGNCAFGNYALYNTTTGNGNTGFGKSSGFNNTTAANNTFIGASTNISPTTATWTNSTALGYGALITASNQIMLGRSSENVNIPGTLRIGSSSGAPVPLYVGGYVSYVGNYSKYLNPYINPDNWTTTTAANISIHAEYGVGCDATYWHSDSRIKKNVVDVPDNLALQLVRDIPSRYYEYIDVVAKGTDKTIGFIAQEVKEVFPMAITQHTKIIPNEYRPLENISWEEIIIDISSNVTYKMSSDLTDVSGVRYRFLVEEIIDGIANMVNKEIIGNSDNTFTFDLSYSNVFCYGKEVDDFHTIDKAKIFALHHSAIQEIDRLQLEEKDKVTALEAKVTELEAKNSVNDYTLIVTEDISLNGTLISSKDICVNSLTIGIGAGDISSNSVFGYQTLASNTTGYKNTAIGYQSGINNTTGSYNTAIGYDSGTGNNSGAYNTFVGASTNANSDSYNYSTALGYDAKITTSNQIVLGNSSITSLNCQVQTITSVSDARDKKNIQPLTNGIAFVDKLNPVKFNWNMRDGGKVDIPEMGFIAQDLQQVQQETGIVIPGLVSDINPDRLEASYGTLVPILVKATQDLSKQVNELKTINATLQSQLNSIMTILTNNNLS